MAISPEDVAQFVRALAAHPEALAELRRLVESDELHRIDEHLVALAEAQRRTDNQLAQLVGRVDQLARHLEALTTVVDKLRGDVLEIRYSRRGHTYFAPIARRLRPIELAELDRILDEGLAAGAIDEDDLDDIRRADLFFRGRSRTDGEEVILVIETSSIVDDDDVHRAFSRAQALARAGHRTLPVVAGVAVSDLAEDEARTKGVWQVTNRRVIPPDAA